MSRSRSKRILVTEVTASGVRRRPDDLIVEEPMTIQLDGATAATTMRTPGHDFELAVGFCHGDGLLAGVPVTGVRYCANGSAADSGFNVVTVETDRRAPAPVARLGTTSSSCGWCGSGEQLDHLCARLAPLGATEPMPVDLLRQLPDRVRARQELFGVTGAVHAAAVFDRDGGVQQVREDVGRHNAVDKVVGALLLGGELPATGRGLFVSGRASFEIVQKAWAAGFGTVVAVSAPTALAVETARRARIVLAGFVTTDRLNVYAPDRLQTPSR